MKSGKKDEEEGARVHVGERVMEMEGNGWLNKCMHA